jgi:hypothetical protein
MRVLLTEHNGMGIEKAQGKVLGRPKIDERTEAAICLARSIPPAARRRWSQPMAERSPP